MAVDGNNRCLGRFGVDESGKGDSFTCDIEILRGELAGILVDVTKDDVSYIFGDMVESMQETDKEVIANFANGTSSTAFDLVVAADGLGSKIRRLAFGNSKSHIRDLDSYISYFSIPPGDTDSMWARVHWVKGGRTISLRPDNVGRTRAFMGVTAWDKSDERLARLAKALKQGIPAQKALLQELFQDAGWEIPRILQGMHESDDLYMQHIAQVRLDRWSSSSGRVTVVGDAGYAVSPFAGMGTSVAFIGAYILAGEISQQPHNIPAALESYERILRPYVQSIQKLPPGIPWLVNPQTTTGIRVLETCIWGLGLLAGTRLAAVLSKLVEYLPRPGNRFKLPEYEAFKS
ncbi:MAG: hypothetical protein Q9191_008495, partial [Dirinaria sp. TL-2023a]